MQDLSAMKRLFDLLFSLAGLLVLSPIFIVLSPLIFSSTLLSINVLAAMATMSRGLLLAIALSAAIFFWISYRKSGKMGLAAPRKYIRAFLLFLAPLAIMNIVAWGIFAPECETGIIGAAALLRLVYRPLSQAIKIIRRTVSADELAPLMAAFVGAPVIFITAFYIRAWIWCQESFVFAFSLSA